MVSVIWASANPAQWTCAYELMHQAIPTPYAQQALIWHEQPTKLKL